MWDLPRPGLEPMSPALAGRFSTTAPPGKPPGHSCSDSMMKSCIYGIEVPSSGVRLLSYQNNMKGFPGGAVVENLPANAGDTGSSPGLGRSHMPRSNWAREPHLLSLRVWSLCSATREAAIVRGQRTAMKSGPHLLQLEKALAQKRRPNTAINK